MRILKIIYKFLGIIFFLTISVCGSMYFLIATETGLRTIVFFAQIISPYPFNIKEVTGSLLTGIAGKEFIYNDN